MNVRHHECSMTVFACNASDACERYTALTHRAHFGARLTPYRVT